MLLKDEEKPEEEKLSKKEDTPESKIEAANTPVAAAAAAPKKPGTVSFKKIYSLQTGSEKCLIIFGLIAAFINGALLPTYAVVLGLSAEAFNPGFTEEERNQKLR